MKGFNRGRPRREGGFDRPGRTGGGFRKPGRCFEGERSEGSERSESGQFRRRGPSEHFSGGFRRGEPDRKFRPKMHEAVCAKCGQSCEVPFRPSPGKPVYCSNCYNKPDTTKRPAQASEQLKEINEKLDRILRALSLD